MNKYNVTYQHQGRTHQTTIAIPGPAFVKAMELTKENPPAARRVITAAIQSQLPMHAVIVEATLQPEQPQ